MNTTPDTEFLDYRAHQVAAFVDRALPDAESLSDVQKAVNLYYAVRDGVRYEVYGADLSRRGLRASSILQAGFGFCVHKSILYAAVLRRVGIPSLIIYADVRNHLASGRLRELVGGDVFCFHSLTAAYLGGRWVRATPVFNRLLCKLYGMKPLEFDGVSDSMYHPFDENGRQHMEFIRTRGEFDDVPYETLVNGLREAHPLLFATPHTTASGSLTIEAAPRSRGTGE